MKVVFVGLLFLNVVFFLWEHNMRPSGGEGPGNRAKQTGASVETILLTGESASPSTQAVNQTIGKPEASTIMSDESALKDRAGEGQDGKLPENGLPASDRERPEIRTDQAPDGSMDADSAE